MILGTNEALHVHHSEIAHQIEFLFVLGEQSWQRSERRFEAGTFPDWLIEKFPQERRVRFIDECLQALRFRAYCSIGFFLDANVEYNYDRMINMEASGRFNV